MARRIRKKQTESVGQLGLFPGAVKKQKTPEQIFAEKLHSAKLIPATIKRKRPKKGSPMTINVKKEVAKATAILRNAKGVNLKALYTILKSGKTHSVESVLKSGAVANIKRSTEEQKKLNGALNVIVYFVNRNSDGKDITKDFAPDVKELVENGRQQRHLKDISQK